MDNKYHKTIEEIEKKKVKEEKAKINKKEMIQNLLTLTCSSLKLKDLPNMSKIRKNTSKLQMEPLLPPN